MFINGQREWSLLRFIALIHKRVREFRMREWDVFQRLVVDGYSSIHGNMYQQQDVKFINGLMVKDECSLIRFIYLILEVTMFQIVAGFGCVT